MKSFLACVCLTAASCVSALATPIAYTATLSNAVPVTGTTSQPSGNPSNPVGAVYYLFSALAGQSVTVLGDRLDGPFDMSFYIFQGQFADTNAFGASFDSSDPGYIAFGDDQDPANVPGPFGDPRSVFNAPVSGLYTIAVTNFLSNGTPPYDFQLVARGITDTTVPEPATMSLLGLGLAGLAFFRRKR